ncbi:alpha/beta hydrolase [Phytomonospora sp. NPDC050363]|uniref:alpha/beta fold hydrolase n=1 Tax=Phytomonospora sp. NPDC050363 TaxID=3155642 RepID=UPI0033C8D493
MTNNSTLTPPLGDYAEVDGRKLWIHKSGDGDGPTVVFLPGASAIGLDYYGVHTQVAGFATSVLYDRGGSGYSDSMPLPRTAEAIAVELHDLLHSQGVPGPYILAPHSLGGAYAHRFAQLFPDEVAGLVFIDAYHYNWDDYVPAELSLAAGEQLAPTYEQLQQALPFMRDFVSQALVDFPDEAREALVDYHVSETWINVGIAERSSTSALAEELAAGPAYPDVPFVALTPLAVDPNQAALMSPELLQTMHDGKRRQYDELAASFTGGQNRVLEDTNHSEIIFNRVDAVVQAIRDVSDRAAKS